MSIEAAVTSCSVRIKDFNTHVLLGTGVLVVPGKVITCHHVVKERSEVNLSGKTAGRPWESRGVALKTTAESASDLALIKLDTPVPDAVCAWLDAEGKVGDELSAFRFTELEPSGAMRSFRIGSGFERDGADRWRVDKRPDKGTSGAGILNHRTGRVCGIVDAQRDIGSGAGFEGATIKVSEIAKAFPEYFEQEFNSLYVRQSWLQALYLDLATFRSRCIEQAARAYDEIGVDYLSRDLLTLTPSLRLMNAWEEFTQLVNWRMRVLRHLRDVLKPWERLPAKHRPPSALQKSIKALAESFSKPQRYPELQNKARLDRNAISQWLAESIRSAELDYKDAPKERDDLLAQIRLSSASLSELREELQQPYRIAFLLTGSVGAGKSTFLRSVLHRWIEEGDAIASPSAAWFPLLLNRPPTQVMLEALLLDKLREATGIEWPDLAAANAYLETLQHRLVVVIDDLHGWVESGAIRGDSPAEILAQLTVYDSFRWLLTSALQGIPRLNRTSVTFDGSPANCWIQLGSGGVAAERSGSGPDVLPVAGHFTPLLSGWHVLDEFNIRDEVGFALLKSHGWKGEEFGESRQFPYRDLLNSRPLLVAILCWLEQRQSVSIQDLATVSIPAFGAALQSWIETWSPSEADQSKQRSEIDREAFDRLTKLIFLSTLANSFASFERRALDAAMETDGEPASGNERLKKVLQHFEGVGAIREGVPLMPSRRSVYDLICQPFWEYRFGLELLDTIETQNGASKNDVLTAVISQARTGSAGGQGARLANGALQQSLLLLDAFQAERLTATQKRRILEGIIRSPEVPASVPLFAGACGSGSLQSRVIGLGLGGRLQEPLDYLALLFFSARVQAGAASPATIVAKLQPYYESFARYGFKDYLAYVLEQKILKCTDQSQFTELLLSLDGCEWSGSADRLAMRAVEQILALWNQDVKGLVLTVKRYARKSTAPKRGKEVEELQKNLQNAGILDRWGDRIHFLHWMLHHTCLEVVGLKGIKAYDFLDVNHWYNPGNDRPHSKGQTAAMHVWPSDDMGKFANFALADKVWRRGQKAEYLKLVSRLANSKKAPDLENAFFLIRHTEVIHSRHELFVVDDQLRPALEELSRKKNLA